KLLGLPLLAERFPTDMLENDTRPPDGQSGGLPGSSSPHDAQKRYRRRLKDIVEHRPQELRIAVNGFLLGAQHVSSEFSSQTLTANIGEPIGFVEVSSEQGVRLLFFDVEQPIEGAVEQQARIEFSHGRTLELTVHFRATWPMVHVVYHDPTFLSAEDAATIESPEQDPLTPLASQAAPEVAPPPTSIGERFLSFGRSLVRRLRDPYLWLRPAAVTAIISIILIATLLLMRPSTPPPVSA